jgi:AcrR family transcriptional regulator
VISRSSPHSPSSSAPRPSGTPKPGHAAKAAKTRIEECAIDLFGRKGFAATSVREIVEAAGVTKPTLYYYFRDKDALYESLFAGAMEAFYGEMVESLAQAKDWAEGLRRLAALHFERAHADPASVRFAFRALLGYGPETPRVDFQRLAERNDACIRGLLDRGVAAGDVAEEAVSEFTVTQFAGLIHIYMMRCAMGFEDDLSGDLAANIVDLFLKGLRSYRR